MMRGWKWLKKCLMSDLKLWKKCLIMSIPTIYLIYSITACCTSVKFFDVLEKSDTFIALAVIWFLVTFGIQFSIAIVSFKEYDNKLFKCTWFNLRMLAYLLFFLPPYCVALHYAYGSGKAVNSTNLIVLQILMPALALSAIIYPLTQRESEKMALATILYSSLNILDMMDIVSDIRHIQHYHAFFHVWFYISFIFSVLSMAFPAALNKDDEDDPEIVRIVKSIVVLIFTDISFLMLRCMVMHKENSLEYGFVFAIKNGFTCIINIVLIIVAINECRKK